MRKLVLALACCLGLTAASGTAGLADLGGTAVVLSCNDGHSVAATVDQATLTNLLADVQAIDASGTGLSCTLDTPSIDPSFESSDWTVYDYNPSGRAISPRQSAGDLPASSPDGGTTWQFNFKPNVYTALFTTRDPSLTGNLCPTPLTCKTLNDSISVNGSAGTFMTQSNGGDCASNFPASVRFFFRSPSASGPSTAPSTGFYTQYWWSNPVHLDLVSGMQSGVIAESLANLHGWSDWNGQEAYLFPEAFTEATQNVQAIGLSFGGDCFFETGVTADPGTVSDEQFGSMFFEN